MNVRSRKPARVLVAAAMSLAAGGSLDAHHSVAMFDTSQPVTISGTLVETRWANPHSYLMVEQQIDDGRFVWAVEGPAPMGIVRRGVQMESFSVGDAIEACGYVLRADDDRYTARNVLVAEVLVLPGGEAKLWSPYGQTHCQDQGVYTITP